MLRGCLELFFCHVKRMFLWHVWSYFYGLIRDCFVSYFIAGLWPELELF